VLELLSLKPAITFTETYCAEVSFPEYDYRQTINPKKRLAKPDPLFEPVPYFQVFAQRWGFTPNLSIIDLLANEGPNAPELLIR